MNKSKTSPLPSNRIFGIFVSLVFLFLSIRFFIIGRNFWIISLIISLLFFSISLFKPIALYRLNYLWLQLGLILGRFLNPIFLGCIYFFLITPLALFLRIAGRDTLRIKIKNNDSYFIKKLNEQDDSFKNQY